MLYVSHVAHTLHHTRCIFLVESHTLTSPQIFLTIYVTNLLKYLFPFRNFMPSFLHPGNSYGERRSLASKPRRSRDGWRHISSVSSWCPARRWYSWRALPTLDTLFSSTVVVHFECLIKWRTVLCLPLWIVCSYTACLFKCKGAKIWWIQLQFKWIWFHCIVSDNARKKANVQRNGGWLQCFRGPFWIVETTQNLCSRECDFSIKPVLEFCRFSETFSLDNNQRHSVDGLNLITDNVKRLLDCWDKCADSSIGRTSFLQDWGFGFESRSIQMKVFWRPILGARI